VGLSVVLMSADDPVGLGAEGFDLGTDAGIPAGGVGFREETHGDEKPT